MQTIATHQGAGALDRFRHRYAQALEWVVMALMVILALEVTLGIVFRTLGRSLVWYDEVASVLLAWLTFYGSALASVKRGHIGCPELVEQLPARLRHALGIVAQLLVLAFFGLLGWVGAWILPILASDALVSLPWVPMSVVQSVIPISCALILVAETLNLVDLLRQRAQHGAACAEGLH
jgi:TRAP-type C4-dicarboxylate transport system permease small subunit